MADLLTDQARSAELPALGATGWSAVDGSDAIRKVWKFKNFVEAWGFMSQCALFAEKLNHHPDWRNIYNVVDVTLTTHDCHGLSHLDIQLAQKMDKLGAHGEVESGPWQANSVFVRDQRQQVIGVGQDLMGRACVCGRSRAQDPSPGRSLGHSGPEEFLLDIPKVRIPESFRSTRASTRRQRCRRRQSLPRHAIP